MSERNAINETVETCEIENANVVDATGSLPMIVEDRTNGCSLQLMRKAPRRVSSLKEPGEVYERLRLYRVKFEELARCDSCNSSNWIQRESYVIAESEYGALSQAQTCINWNDRGETVRNESVEALPFRIRGWGKTQF